MAALTMTVPTAGGTAATVNTASASDTISQGQLGTQGVNLIVQSTGTVCNVTISDSGSSPAGNPATVTAVATVATGFKVFYISPSQANLATGNVTITASPITGLFYIVVPA